MTQVATKSIAPEKRTHAEHITKVERLADGALYGYARVSPMEQSEAEQIASLRAAGVTDDSIYIDIDGDRNGHETEYFQMLTSLRRGDILIIGSVGALGKTYDEVIAQWQMLTKVKHVDVVVLDIPLLDTRTRRQKVGDDFIADLTLQFLAYAALREREGMRQRQHEGILAAKQRGVRFGRPPKPIPPEFEDTLARWKNKEISSRKAAQLLGVAQETFLRWSRKRA